MNATPTLASCRCLKSASAVPEEHRTRPLGRAAGVTAPGNHRRPASASTTKLVPAAALLTLAQRDKASGVTASDAGGWRVARTLAIVTARSRTLRSPAGRVMAGKLDPPG
jgi:hypothetical protein